MTPMVKPAPVVALFGNPAQAQRLVGELRAAGVADSEMTLLAASMGTRAEIVDALANAGIDRSDAALFADEVCGGATLLTLDPHDTQHWQITEIIARHQPTQQRRPEAKTSKDIEAERIAEPISMPTGSGVLDSRCRLVEEGED